MKTRLTAILPLLFGVLLSSQASIATDRWKSSLTTDTGLFTLEHDKSEINTPGIDDPDFLQSSNAVYVASSYPHASIEHYVVYPHKTIHGYSIRSPPDISVKAS